MQRDDSTEGFKKLLDRFQVDALNNKVTIKDASVGNLKADDTTEWTVEFNFPNFDEIKAELAEKYKLTPAEEAQNKAVELGKKWGTNPNGKKITPYTKAMEAGEEHARLIFDREIDKDDDTASHSISLSAIIQADLFNTISLSSFIEKCSTSKEFKEYLKEQNVKIEDFNEKDISIILDKWPDFFEGEELPEIKEGNSESRIPYTNKPKTFDEVSMDAPTNKIYYHNIDISNDKAMTRMQTLFDKLDKDEEPKPVKTKMSYKQQQRMRKNNPMWKLN